MARRVDVNKAREIAGEAVDGMSDDELTEFLDLLYTFSRLIADRYAKESNGTQELEDSNATNRRLHPSVIEQAGAEPLARHSGQSLS